MGVCVCVSLPLADLHAPACVGAKLTGPICASTGRLAPVDARVGFEPSACTCTDQAA
jgi:hypothetical protein